MRFWLIALVVAFLAPSVAHADNDVPMLQQSTVIAWFPEWAPSGFSTEPLMGSMKQVYDVEPMPAVQHSPAYPDAAKLLRLCGRLTVWVLVNTEGCVVEVRIPEEWVFADEGKAAWKQAPRIFGQVSSEAAWRWRFMPALSQGKPIEAWIGIPFQFGRTTPPN